MNQDTNQWKRHAAEAEAAADEFPAGTSEWAPGLSRRAFLQFSSATLGLLGLTACSGRRKLEKIVPYVRQPDELAAAETLPFASAQVLEGLATGIVLESFEGRPVKADGNPDHPASLGGSSPWIQAHVAGLFSPARARAVQAAGEASGWAEFAAYAGELRRELARNGGRGLRLLTEVSTSPSFAAAVGELRRELPGLRWVQFDPLYRGYAARGCELAFGRALDPIYDFSRADLIVSLDADFLHRSSAPLRYTREFALRRRGKERNFLWMAEASPTLTGANADFRLSVSPGRLADLARALLRPGAATLEPACAQALEDLRGRVARAGNRVVFLAGEQQPPWVHAVCHSLNARHGAVGGAVRYIAPVRSAAHTGIPALAELTEEMRAGKVEALLCIGGNPVYNAPADLDFAGALARVKHRVRLGFEADETADASHWSLPQSHPLESWGDALAFDGTITFQQPLLDPLFDTRAPAELLTLLAGRERRSEDIVRDYWSKKTAFAAALAQGFVEGSARPPVPITARPFNPPAAAPRADFELVFRPDYGVHDGRFFHNHWLQELPRPLTELTWGNAVLLAPADAKRLGLASGQLARARQGARSLTAPVWVQPGHPAGAATLLCGYGRQLASGEVLGYNAFALATSQWPDAAPGSLEALDGHAELACAQENARLGERAPVQFLANSASEAPAPEPPTPRSLYPENPGSESPYAWGMVIDLSRCVGCRACVAACQAENNIPTVGKKGVQRGREMHWIRVDRYFRGDEAAPEILFQPVPCMHCEKAPCEPVCPVAATVHNDEGLNQMVYNRCVGTRYCSNNCPYKVRRFNFFEYNQGRPELEQLLKNPDVSVRPRGVMEKCSYCVQRIDRARIHAEREDRLIREGEVVTACQAACPARAISFGNLRDPAAEVSAWRRKAGHYALLGELGTRPRTTYLAKVKEDGAP